MQYLNILLFEYENLLQLKIIVYIPVSIAVGVSLVCTYYCYKNIKRGKHLPIKHQLYFVLVFIQGICLTLIITLSLVILDELCNCFELTLQQNAIAFGFIFPLLLIGITIKHLKQILTK